MEIPVISITGTKGKTTVAYVVDSVLLKNGHNVLRVDTAGHYVNGKRKSSLDDSKAIWGLVPTVAPGRYLWEFKTQPKLKNKGVAVLETAIGSSQPPGLGYRSHKIGVFLNIFEDHLGSSNRLKTRADIAKAKQFIFSRLERDGWAVFNADEKLITDRLKVIPKHLNIKLLPCGLSFSHFALSKHLKSGGQALTVKNNKVILLSQSSTKTLIDLKLIPWSFNGSFMPSVWNLMMSVGAIYAFKEGQWTKKLSQTFESIKLDDSSGRLTLLRAKNGGTVLIDYAHEEKSLIEISKLAKQLKGPKGQVIGIVRLANDRTNELISKTGMSIGKAYDKCIVYDKIDGHWRQPRLVRSLKFPEVVGRVSTVLSEAIARVNPNVQQIIREDLAVKRAAELLGPNDVAVYIVNDNIERSLKFAKRFFKAEVNRD